MTAATSLPVPANIYPHTFYLRNDVGDASKEGFFFVGNGILVVRDDTEIINIYEGEAFRTNGGYDSIPVLQINLRTVASIEFKKIYSTGLNFEGGMMTITNRCVRSRKSVQ